MHGIEHAFILLRSSDSEHARMLACDFFRFSTHAAGDDHLAVLRHCSADGRKRLRLRAVDKTAGIDDGEIGAGMLAREFIALGAEPRNDPLGIDQGFRAAERDEGNAGRSVHRGLFIACWRGQIAHRHPVEIRSWCRDVLAQIRPEPLFRHQKVRQAPSIHRARPALLVTSSGEIKDFAALGNYTAHNLPKHLQNQPVNWWRRTTIGRHISCVNGVSTSNKGPVPKTSPAAAAVAARGHVYGSLHTG